MGCLNSNGQFNHWFGNIHLSGPCNRKCVFCIGQHMMALDPYNNLDVWPLVNIDQFVAECAKHNINEINLTGSNTDPLLYKHIFELREYLDKRVPNLKFGLRTNGADLQKFTSNIEAFDKLSISITSFNPDIYKATMGVGKPPDLKELTRWVEDKDVKINIVLCPEVFENYVGYNWRDTDLFKTLKYIAKFPNIVKINVRRAYGQPALQNPFANFQPEKYVFGNPSYNIYGLQVTIWDVHYTEVESVNLYANGIVSTTYPVTAGHHPSGDVKGPENFKTWGRKNEQWLKYKN